MYRCLGTVRECKELEGKLPRRVYEEILRGLVVLDSEFGSERDYLNVGGFSLIALTEEDLRRARDLFDDRWHYCEWSTRIANTGYVSALYLLNNEFSVMLYTKESLANEDILENLED